MPQNDIIIVDDNPANLKLLEEMLVQQGHDVRSFPLGRLALTAAANHPPDLILLDINMPEMNGYEVCERLKAHKDLSSIPVIFLSALTEVKDKVKGFQSGAVDFISKPFQFEEVHARVETHLKLHDLQQKLKRHNERLEEAVAARTQELAEANARLTILDSSKSEFLNLISHEFRTPLNGLVGIAEIILAEAPATKENSELRELFDRSRRRIISILDDALLLTQIDVSGRQFSSAPVALRRVVRNAMEDANGFAKSRRVLLQTPPPNEDVVLGDAYLLARALRTLIETAVKFSDEGGSVAVSQVTARDSVDVVIESRGTTIPPAAVAHFFDLFTIGEASTPGVDLGLGPAVAYRILALFGASVTVGNLDSSGIQITVTLKMGGHHATGHTLNSPATD